MLRAKNRLMRRGRLEKAMALSDRIRKTIIRANTKFLSGDGNKLSSSEMWRKVNQLVKNRPAASQAGCVDANLLNSFYAKVSTDSDPGNLLPRQSCLNPGLWPTEAAVFRYLEALKTTSPGPDNLPFWALKLGAPYLASPISELFRRSLSESVVPLQWKTAVITPIPKLVNPTSCEHYRPISITCSLSRVLEKMVVRHYIYPLFSSPDSSLTENLRDQFAFRPTGSTTAALVAIMQKVTEYLQTEPYVRLVALDFSRAFDTVRTSSLFSKLANSELPDNIYNWLLQFFTNRTHSTNFNGFTSPSLHINSSIVQGSGMGPATYAVNSSDLHPKNVQVTIFKYADDVFPIIPASLDCVTANEIENIAGWASRNNLRLNEAKSREIIFRKKGVTISPPPPRCGNISRHSQIDILGVIVTETLSVAPHVARVEARCSQALYAIKTLRAHGLGGLALHNVCRLLLESRLLYAAPLG